LVKEIVIGFSSRFSLVFLNLIKAAFTNYFTEELTRQSRYLKVTNWIGFEIVSTLWSYLLVTIVLLFALLILRSGFSSLSVEITCRRPAKESRQGTKLSMLSNRLYRWSPLSINHASRILANNIG
jgi:hypothetical protein